MNNNSIITEFDHSLDNLNRGLNTPSIRENPEFLGYAHVYLKDAENLLEAYPQERVAVDLLTKVKTLQAKL